MPHLRSSNPAARILALVVLALTLVGCKKSTPQGGGGQPGSEQTSGSLQGAWNGTYRSKVYPQIKGSFEVDLTQTGNEISGRIKIAGSPCVSKGNVSGSIQGTHFEFGAVQAEREVSFTGNVSGNSMSGTWDAPDCGDDHGSWNAHKT